MRKGLKNNVEPLWTAWVRLLWGVRSHSSPAMCLEAKSHSVSPST